MQQKPKLPPMSKEMMALPPAEREKVMKLVAERIALDLMEARKNSALKDKPQSK